MVKEISVLSWNIFSGLGYPNSTYDHILKFLKSFLTHKNTESIKPIFSYLKMLEPDIIALQEAKQEYFESKLTFNYFRNGNGLTSKLPFLEVKSLNLPYLIEKRNLIAAKIQIKNKELTFINLHLAAHKINSHIRKKQILFLLNFINNLQGPFVVAGDFNCEPNSNEFKFLISNNLTPIFHTPTYPSYNPTKKFDNMLVSPEIKVKDAKVLPFKASDHLPIYAKLEI